MQELAVSESKLGEEVETQGLFILQSLPVVLNWRLADETKQLSE